MAAQEVFFSFDVEASGPVPGLYNMLSIGGCMVDQPDRRFYTIIKPMNDNFIDEAVNVAGITLDQAKEEGCEPKDAMWRLVEWVRACLPSEEARPVFVGLNAGFDWAFVNYYLIAFNPFDHTKDDFQKINPFGYASLDIKSYFMGATGCAWQETRSRPMRARLNPEKAGTHNALEDAEYQAELFRRIRNITEDTGSKSIG